MSNIKKPTRNVSGVGAITPLYQSDIDREEKAIELLGDKWEDFVEYVDGIEDWDMSDVERYLNR